MKWTLSGWINRLLLLLGSLMLLVACNGKESSMLAKTTQFNYSVNIGYPEGYYVIYDRSHSILSDDKGKPLISFGGWIAAGAGWGTGVQSTEYRVPYCQQKI